MDVRPHPPALTVSPPPVGCRPCWASFPCAPDPWIALRVEDRDQEYRLRFRPIEQAVRKPSKQGPSDTPMHQGKLLGVRDCRVQSLPHGRQEFLAESSSRPFVPVVCVFDIAGRFRADDNVAGHRPVVRSRATISSQGMPVAASRSMLSSRRSSSARCGGVKGIECGVSARPSHSRSTRRSRSSSERRPMSICGVVMAIVSHRPLVSASTSVDAQRPSGGWSPVGHTQSRRKLEPALWPCWGTPPSHERHASVRSRRSVSRGGFESRQPRQFPSLSESRCSRRGRESGRPPRLRCHSRSRTSCRSPRWGRPAR